MVYPERVFGTRSGDRTRTTSWFSSSAPGSATRTEHCELNTTVKSFSARNAERVERAETSLSDLSKDGVANQEFIQDRIRHLVEAFSSRARAARDQLDSSGTSSTRSSCETISPLQDHPRLSICSIDPAGIEELDPAHTLCDNLKYIWENKVIDPNGKAYVAWISITAVSVIYNYWVIPLRSTFPYQNSDNRVAWMCFDYLADIVYALDLVMVQPRIKYLLEGFWVTDMVALRKNYIQKPTFKLDVISLLPLDLLYLITGPDVVILRFPRFFKVHSFWQCFSFVDKLLSNPYAIRISKTLIYMMYLIHVNACAYYAFSRWEGIGANEFVYNGRGHPYIKCFYFATKTATSIGKNPKPTQEWEYIFMTCSWLMGVFVFAVLIGQIRDVISSANRQRNDYRRLVADAIRYMRKANVPAETQRRVKQWFNYTWKMQRTLSETKILDCLPHKLKTDIAINVHISTLSKVKLFADCEESLLREIVLQLKSVIYLPGDIICKKGAVGNEMYIIRWGIVRVLGGASGVEVLATLGEGSVFGEISLLGIPGRNRRTADVRSDGYANLFVLSKSDLNEALRHYPEAQMLLNRKARALMRQNAALEKRQEPVIVIENPDDGGGHPKQAKLMDTVLQVLPPETKTSRLLRYGSRSEKNRDLQRHESRKSLPSVKYEFESRPRKVTSVGLTFETPVLFHRAMEDD